MSVSAHHITPIEPTALTRPELEQADELLKHQPELLSDRHLGLMAAYSPDRARQAFAARQKALALKAAPPVVTKAAAPPAKARVTKEQKYAAVDAMTEAVSAYMLAATDDELDKSTSALQEAFQLADKTLKPIEQTFSIVMMLRAVSLKNVERNEKIAALESELVAVKSSMPSYQGTYDDAMTYRRGHMVNRNGSMWLCDRDGIRGISPDNSSEGQSAWRLVAARGKEGKQGPPGRCTCV